jgi:hypothetical protein
MSDDHLLIGRRPRINPLDTVELERKLRPLFAGYHPAAQGGALAALVALFIAGHRNPDAGEQKRMRRELFRMHLKMVRQMIPEADREIDDTIKRSQPKPVLN